MGRRQRKLTKKAPARSKARLQFMWVDTGSKDLGRVYFPVRSKAEGKRRRKELIEKAIEFQRKWMFIQRVTSSKFLLELADDFSRRLPVQRLAAARFAASLLERYGGRLKEALHSDSPSKIISSRPFLKAKKRSKHLTVTFDPPPDFDERLVEICSDFIRPLFVAPKTAHGYNFWQNFAKWIWTNQMTNAIEDLEMSLGKTAVRTMPAEDLFNAALKVFSESLDAHEEFGRLTDLYVQDLIDIVTSKDITRKLSLEQFEVLIGLSSHSGQRSPSIQFRSIADQLETLLVHPSALCELAPRRFEELVAFGLEKSGYDHVRLTPKTRDGGYDIEALRYRPIRQRLLVECKRYAAARKVGRPTLDALLGVLHRERANQALLATTASFSKEAQQLLEQEQWRLQGMNFDELIQFLRDLRAQ